MYRIISDLDVFSKVHFPLQAIRESDVDASLIGNILEVLENSELDAQALKA